jgi:hypothetical protein
MSESKLIHSFPKNPLEEVRASITEFKRRRYVDVRVYFKGDDGDFMPTKKGLTISIDLVDELAMAVLMLKEAIKKLGQ